jgi:hypothetical protein
MENRKTPQGVTSPYRYLYPTGEQCEVGDIVQYGGVLYIVQSGNGGMNPDNPQVKLIGTKVSPSIGMLRLVSRRPDVHHTDLPQLPRPAAQLSLFPLSPTQDGTDSQNTHEDADDVSLFLVVF